MSQAKRQQVINSLETAIDNIERAADAAEEENAIDIEVAEESAMGRIRNALDIMDRLKRQREPRPPRPTGLPRRMRQR